MEYEEIVTAYKNGSLDISDLKKKLEISRPLEGRPQQRILDKSIFYFDIVNLMRIPEKPDKVDIFEHELEYILNGYYNSIINSIKELKAWKYMNLMASEYSLEKFKKLSKHEKITRMYDISKKYSEFLEKQKVADIRDTFKPLGELSKEEIEELEFLQKMFNGFNTKNTKSLFNTLKKNFIMSLIDFKKSKTLRLEEFMQEKSQSKRAKDKEIFREYKACSSFFTTEEYRDIVENLLFTSKTLKKPIGKIIEYYTVMSDSYSEIEMLEEFVENFKEVEKKYLVMNSLKIEAEKEKRLKENIELRKKQIEETKKRQEEIKKSKLDAEKRRLYEKEKAERERIIAKEEGSTGEMKRTVNKLENTPAARELVKPLVFFWFGKEDLTLAKTIGVRKLNEFFNTLKQYEKKFGVRISLFMITNADKSVTRKRIEELQEKAEEKGMPRLVEGALGGYSSFKIDKNGNVIDIAQMSFENREKIKKLLDRSLKISLPVGMIDQTEENYLRYEFSDKKDPSIDMNYLRMMASRLIKDPNISKQPLKFIPYMEKNHSGIDVLLESQYKGLSQLADYYRAKYHLANGHGLQANVSSIDDFLSKTLEENEAR